MSIRDDTGRVPFAIVAVLLLMSAGVSALYSAHLAWEEASRRAREGRLAALGGVEDLIHEEVQAQAERIAVRAIRGGIDGIVNESRIGDGFREGFADYVAYHFPRVVRGVEVRVTAFDAGIQRAPTSMQDFGPTYTTRVERLGDLEVPVPNPLVSEELAPSNPLARYAIIGFMNYSLALDGTALVRSAMLQRDVPVPVPFLATRIAQAGRSGLGEVSGVGGTVKAILATVAQFRVLSGMASPAKPGTTTADILTSEDVALAVNFALLLEEVRLFRAYDRDAAGAIDAARGDLPPIPDTSFPPAAERSLSHLLETYAADGTLDAVDLFALYTGLDVSRLSIASVLAQAIAGIGDQIALKALDYMGLTPLADFLFREAAAAYDTFDAFLRWIGGRPTAQVEYIHQYLRAMLVDTGIGTDFLGPTTATIPGRAYDVPNGSAFVRIAIPEHTTIVSFSPKDLLSREYDSHWQAFFPRLNASVALVDRTLRGFVNELSTRVASNAILAGLLPESAAGRIDPKDDVSFLAVLADRVGRAVDDAIVWVRSDPNAVPALLTNLWESARAVLGGVVNDTIVSYDDLASADTEIAGAAARLVTDLYAKSTDDPDYAGLNASQRGDLRTMISADADASGWVRGTYESQRQRDADRWRAAVSVANGARLRGELTSAVVGASGALVLAGDMVHGLLRESTMAQGMAGLRATVRTSLAPFSAPGADGVSREFRLSVHHFPRFLPGTPWIEGGALREGDLRIGITDPSAIPLDPATPNVHHTNPDRLSDRPFATEWAVRIEGLVRLRIETTDRPLLGDGGLEPAALEDLWPLDLDFSVPAFSGWNLTGVAYHASNTFSVDLWRWITQFLDWAWHEMAPILNWILDGIRGIVKVVMEIVRPILEFAHRVVEFLTRVVAAQVDLLRKVVIGAVDLVGRVVDMVTDLFGDRPSFHVRTMGVDLVVSMGGAAGREIEILADAGTIRGTLAVVDLEEANRARPDIPRYDLIASWDVAVGPFGLHAGFDPFQALQEGHVVEGFASWRDSWTMDLAGPELDRISVVGFAPEFEVVVPPFGTVRVLAGVEARFAEPPEVLAQEVIRRAFDAATAEVGSPRTWEALGTYLTSFARHLLAESLEALERAVDVRVYAEVDGKAGGVAGGGLRFVFAAEGTAIRAVLEWLVRNLVAYFAPGWFNPFAPADLSALLRVAAEHTWIGTLGYFELEAPLFLRDLVPLLAGRLEAGVSIRANVAAIGAALGRDWGAWEVEFAAYGFAMLGEDGVAARLPFAYLGSAAEVAILRGTMHAA